MHPSCKQSPRSEGRTWMTCFRKIWWSSGGRKAFALPSCIFLHTEKQLSLPAADGPICTGGLSVTKTASIAGAKALEWVPKVGFLHAECSLITDDFRNVVRQLWDELKDQLLQWRMTKLWAKMWTRMSWRNAWPSLCHDFVERSDVTCQPREWVGGSLH